MIKVQKDQRKNKNPIKAPDSIPRMISPINSPLKNSDQSDQTEKKSDSADNTPKTNDTPNEDIKNNDNKAEPNKATEDQIRKCIYQINGNAPSYSKSFRCDICKKEFKSEFDIIEHIMSTHAQKQAPLEKTIQEKVKQGKIIICDHCGKQFLTKPMLNQHLASLKKIPILVILLKRRLMTKIDPLNIRVIPS